MPERPDGGDVATLERALADLGRAIDFPATPDIAGRVRGRLTAPRPSLLRWPRAHRRRAALVAAVVALALALTLALIPGARETVADRFGLRGVRFVGTDGALPSPMPQRDEASGTVAEVGERLGLGRAAGLDEARAAVAFPIVIPAALGPPDAVFIATFPAGGQVTLLYRPRTGLPPAADPDVALLLSILRGDAQPSILKGLPAGARVVETAVAGRRAYWIEGAPHAVVIRDQSGTFREERARIAGNTLLWERDGVTYRLESALDRAGAVRIAESIR